MGATTIEWTATMLPDGTSLPGYSFNPWIGCQKVSPACDHCYAEGWAKRTGQPSLWQGERRRTSDANWRAPMKWNRDAARTGIRRKVFCASLADVFDNHVPDEWRADLWDLIWDTPNLTWLLLTKRPQNILKMLPSEWGTRGFPGVWLGTTAEDAHHYRQRWRHLADIPCRLRFLSYEPALGPIGDLELHRTDAPRWIIAGGESGAAARPSHPDWFRSLRDQCAATRVPFFFKQWGEWLDADSEEFQMLMVTDRRFDGMAAFEEPVNDCYRVGKRRSGALLDGREWREFPDA